MDVVPAKQLTTGIDFGTLKTTIVICAHPSRDEATVKMGHKMVPNQHNGWVGRRTSLTPQAHVQNRLGVNSLPNLEVQLCRHRLVV